MDNTGILDENYSSKIALSEDAKGYLKEAAKWAKFISIIGFIYVGLMVLMSIFTGLFMGSMASDFGATSAMPLPPILFSVLFPILYLIIALIMLIPILFLYRFAKNMQIALKGNDERALTDSFRNLKSHYKFYGIFIAVILCLYAFMLVIGIIGGASSFMVS